MNINYLSAAQLDGELNNPTLGKELYYYTKNSTPSFLLLSQAEFVELTAIIPPQDIEPLFGPMRAMLKSLMGFENFQPTPFVPINTILGIIQTSMYVAQLSSLPGLKIYDDAATDRYIISAPTALATLNAEYQGAWRELTATAIQELTIIGTNVLSIKNDKG